MLKIDNLRNLIKGKRQLLAKFENNIISLASELQKVNTWKNSTSQDVRKQTKNHVLNTVHIRKDMTFEK